MDEITLASDRLKLVLNPPGAVYKGSRFDWTTQVSQVSFDGVGLLTREKKDELDLSRQGFGLTGEFGLSNPVGFDPCPVGGQFPKIGVGLLTKPDALAYRFNRDYEVLPARFQVRRAGSSEVIVTADSGLHDGYGWFLKRHWSVRGCEITLITSLANTGSLPLNTDEYIHNFWGMDGVPVGPAWQLTLARPLDPKNLVEWVNPEDTMRVTERGLGWSSTPTRDFFLSDQRQPNLERWTLSHTGTGLSIDERVDFPTVAFNLWGKGHVISPELYYRVELTAGSSATWTRRWTLGKED